jgi:hypothetical protein
LIQKVWGLDDPNFLRDRDGRHFNRWDLQFNDLRKGFPIGASRSVLGSFNTVTAVRRAVHLSKKSFLTQQRAHELTKGFYTDFRLATIEE